METSHDVPADPAAAPQPDWTYALPREAFAAVILILRVALPPPLVDTPAEWVLRDRVAMAAVGALAPATAAEGKLAAQFVAADAHSMDCLRLSNERAGEWEVSRRCKAQAMSMMRESKTALRMLLRLQAERRALAQDAAAAGTAEWVEHAALGLMAEALAVAAPAKVAPPAADFLAGADAVARALKSGRASVDGHGSRERRVETTAGFYAPGDRARS